MSNIDRAFIDDLLSRIDIVDVIGEVVKLKKAGANHKGLCPFHSEKTPSFNVSSAKQFYHCFGCGASGDAIKFLREHEGLSFVDAVEKLASMANMEVPKNNKINQEDMGLYEANKLALQFFINSLNKNKVAMDYLISRGIDTDMIEKFDIGYAGDSWDSLKKYFYQNKKLEAAIELGLVVKNQDKVYDRFRNRIMFPIKNNSGRVIAFGGRTIDKNEKAKYINSPESKLFFKSAEIYGLYESKNEIHKKESIVIVEGYTDVISLHKHGYYNVVATLGTAFTKFHIRKIKRISSEIIFCFDGDDAGKSAANKAMNNVLPELNDGLDIRFCFLEKGKDPDEICQEDSGALNTYFNNSMRLSEYMIDSAKENLDLNNIEDKVKFIQNIKNLSGKLPDGIFKKLFIQEIKKISQVNLNEDLKENTPEKINTDNKSVKLSKIDSVVLSTLLKFPELSESLEEYITELTLSPKIKEMISLIPKYKNKDTYILNKFLEEDDEIKNLFINHSSINVLDNDIETAAQTITSIIENHKKTKQDKEYNVILDKFSQGEDLTLEEREVLKNYKK